MFRKTSSLIAHTPMRFLSTQKEKNLKVQFMHIVPHKDYPTGMIKSGIPTERFNLDVLTHDTKAQAIMEQQAERIVSCMRDILHLAHSNRGAYEKSKQKHISNNSVVQVTTPEFFFYPAFGLLSEEIFKKKILLPLQRMLTTLPSWLHFHFGTMPVQITSGILNGVMVNSKKPIFINAAIYGNGGKQAVVGYYSKRYPYKVEEQDEPFGPIIKKGDPYVHNFETMDFGFPRCIYSEGPEGGVFIKAFDICLDHQSAVALEEYLKIIALLKEAPDIKGFYLISSYTVPIYPNHTIFPLFAQVDPLNNAVYNGIAEKKSIFFGLQSVPIQEKEFVEIPSLSEHSWVPFKMKVFNSLEMATITEHTKKLIEENSHSTPKP